VRPPPRGFLSGGITVAELRPLRSVPFRVVALVGMNDRLFPRSERRLAFDLMSSDRRLGDRSARDDDRYQFLETLLATRERLIVTYTGIDASQGSSLPPSPLVAELVDVLVESVVSEDASGGSARAARSTWVTRHPLHPFAPRYFEGGNGEPVLFSFQSHHLAGARALGRPPEDPPPFIKGPVPLPEGGGEALAPLEEVTLDALVDAVLTPASVLAQQRLGIGLVWEETLPDDREPASLDGLSAYKVREILMGRLERGEPVSDSVDALLAMGLLPFGSAGRVALAKERQLVEALVEAACRARGGDRLDQVAVHVPLREAIVTGWLREVYPAAQVMASPGKLTTKRLMRGWVYHLALSGLGQLSLPKETILIGLPEGKAKTPVATHTFRPMGADTAMERLACLVTIYRLAHQVPVRLFPRSSKVFAAQEKKSEDRAKALHAARSKWLGSDHEPGEAANPAHALLYGSENPLPAPDGLAPDGRQDPELSFAHLAQHVWGELLKASGRRRG